MLKLYRLLKQDNWLPLRPPIKYVLLGGFYQYGITAYQVPKEGFGSDYEILHFQGLLSYDGYLRRTTLSISEQQLEEINPKVLMTHASANIRRIGALLEAQQLTERKLLNYFN